MTAEVTAYVPSFNNASTVRMAVESLLNQSYRPLEVLVVDDGSTDGTHEAVSHLPVRLVRHETNLGRGAARATAMKHASCDLVVCCDATSSLGCDFVEKSLMYFNQDRVAAVFGQICQTESNTVTLRWRARHLYHLNTNRTRVHRAPLASGGAMVSKKLVAQVGGFNAALRHNEDSDLGERLLRAGYDVVFDPALVVLSRVDNTIGELLERYWRWNAGSDENVSWLGYKRNVIYSIKGMARKDLQSRDPLAALISLLCPHYQFWKSKLRGLGAQRGEREGQEPKNRGQRL
jgi:GT2 family glycosyltransferase